MESTIRFSMKDTRSVLAPMEGLSFSDRPKTAAITCSCGQRIELYAEIDRAEFDLTLRKYCLEMLSHAYRVVGGADEFFQEKLGQSYVESLRCAELRFWHRLIEKVRAQIDGQEGECDEA